MSELLLLDRAARRRSPATMPGFHSGRPPRNKGFRYPADPHVSTTARSRIPLRDRDSSGWIRTTDLTIMSHAPPCEGRAQAGIGGHEIPARRQFCGSACLPGVSARIRPGGRVVDPRRGALTQARRTEIARTGTIPAERRHARRRRRGAALDVRAL
jgi:hypothetical protein